MKKIIPWVVYGLCVFISRQFCTGYWVVGPVFGVALLLFNSDRVFKKLSSQHLVFLITSTLIYALVYWIAANGWKFRSDWLDALAGSASAGVVLGSLLMPLIHGRFFGMDPKTVLPVSIFLIAGWYAVTLVSLAVQVIGPNFRFDFLFIAIALWQGIYMKHLKP